MTNQGRYYLILKRRSDGKILPPRYRCMNKRDLQARLKSLKPKYPVTKFQYILGVGLLTIVRRRAFYVEEI